MKKIFIITLSVCICVVLATFYFTQTKTIDAVKQRIEVKINNAKTTMKEKKKAKEIAKQAEKQKNEEAAKDKDKDKDKNKDKEKIEDLKPDKIVETSKITINQVADKIRNTGNAKQFINDGVNFTVEENQNVLNIKYNNKNYEYKLENGILTNQILKSDSVGIIILATVIDSVGQVHGYQDGQTLSTLQSDEGIKYTIKDGYEITYDEVSAFSKIDINKKIRLVSPNN